MITPENTLRQLNELRKNKRFCDVIIVVEGQKFHCHLGILVSNIPYFEHMFSGNFKEIVQREVTLEDVDASSFEFLLEYIYTGTTNIDGNNLERILSVADFFGVECLTVKCVEYTKDIINPQNVLEYHLFADNYRYVLLKECTQEFIQENFIAVAKTKNFLNVSFSIIQELISNDYTVVDDEQFILQTVVTWVNHNPKKRVKYINDLLREVRLKFLTPEYVLNQASRMKIIPPETYSNMKAIVQNQKTDENPLKWRKCILIFYTNQGFYSDKVKVISLNGSNIKPMPHISFQGIFLNIIVTSSKNRLYMFSDEFHKQFRNFNCFNHDVNKWVPLKRLDVKTSLHCMVSLNNKIYANSYGIEHYGTTNFIYTYNTELDKWKPLRASGYVDEHGSKIRTATLVTHENGIYSIGGEDKDDCELSIVKLLDPRIGKWITRASTPIPTSETTAATLNNNIYVKGIIQDIKSMLKYDIVADKWVTLNILKSRYGTNRLVSHRNKLFSVDETIIQTYNPTTELWSDGPDIKSIIPCEIKEVISL